MLNIWEVYCVLVSELQQGENSEDSNVPLVSALWPALLHVS